MTPALIDTLTRLIPFAPNHLPDEIALIRALAQHRPAVAQLACFDTAFHANLPDVSRRLPIPAKYDAVGVRRYGFHGISCEFLLGELERVAGPAAAAGRIVIAHLGNGSSLTAVNHRRSVDTTMALTPIAGVPMSTRSGDLDPGVLTHIARLDELSADKLEDLFSHQAGLLGISGVSGDVRDLLDREAGDPACRLALAVYVYGIKKAVGALAAALGGLETLIFSGGIGEHASAIRARVCEALEFLGIRLDLNRNRAHAPVVSTADAAVTVRVIPTDEERMIARTGFRLLGAV